MAARRRSLPGLSLLLLLLLLLLQQGGLLLLLLLLEEGVLAVGQRVLDLPDPVEVGVAPRLPLLQGLTQPRATEPTSASCSGLNHRPPPSPPRCGEIGPHLHHASELGSLGGGTLPY